MSEFVKRIREGVKWEKNTPYTRGQLVDALGIGPGYLPLAEGKVAAGLFDPSTNAVTHLDGTIDVYPKVLSKGAKQLTPDDKLPAFLKISTQYWHYVGEYSLEKIDRSKRAVERAGRETGRDDIAAVLHFKPAT